MPTPVERPPSRVDESPHRVRQRVRLMVVLSTLLTSLVIGGIATFLLYQNRVQTLHEQKELIIEFEAAALRVELERMAGLARQITSATRIREGLERFNSGAISQQAAAYITGPEFRDAMRANRDVLGVTRLAADGTQLLSVGSEIPMSHRPDIVPDSARTTGRPGAGFVVISTPVRDHSMATIGTDLVKFRDDRLREIVQRLFSRLENKGSIQIGALLDGRAHHFYDVGDLSQPLGHEALKSELIARLQLGTHDGLRRPGTTRSGRILVTRGPIGNAGWVLLVRLEPDELYAGARRQAVYAALTILILAFISIALTGRAVQPLVNHIAGENRRLQQMLRRNRELLDAVAANEAKLQAVIDNAPAVIYIKDREGRYLLVNNSFERMVACPRDQIVGRYDYEIFPEDVAKSSRDTDLTVLETGNPLELDEEAPQADGTHDYLSIKFPLRDSSGDIYGLCGIASDITERKQAERELQQSATVFNCTAEAIVITDIEGTILDVNAAFCDFLGYERNEVLGQNPRIWKSDLHDESFYREMWQTVRMKGKWRSEIINRNKNGAATPALATVSTVHDKSGNAVGHVAIYTDVSQLKKSQQELTHLAYHDALTNLPNRALFYERLEHCLERAVRRRSQSAVIFVDLDRFKHINDSLGHSHGDQLLIRVAKLLSDAVRSEDTVARIGGDEFTILIEEVRDRKGLITVMEKVLWAFESGLRICDANVCVTPSIGISVYPDDGQDAETLMRNADAAMYRAKANGRNTYRFFSETNSQPDVPALTDGRQAS